MIFILSKILLFLFKPIVWIFVLLILAIAAKQPKQRKRYLVCLLIILLFFSNAFIVGKITSSYEAGYPKAEKYDVGIVLGGFSGLNKRNNEIAFNWAGDRLFQTIALYKKGQIKQILLSGGSANLIDQQIKEADLAIKYLKLIGIPDSAILIENQSRNTVENAKYSLALIAKKNPKAKILVITSAWHIPRAKLIFDKQTKHKIEYYPTNFSGSTEFEFSDFIIPNTSALGAWEMLFKEWIGLTVDRIRA
ncbi:YdcF family protein [Pedobacter psychrodurus]|uniref:YdcF family protein n=1 Tax=Pedobacter psychrodurus TaxID=2530456 RepID=A0A4R0Q0T3_9SPHI|nr:YdcF family protein [Pedobacter psychrodurus]TCD26780.1 YdcF family protein [Pedobacter psychrodurus]